MNSDYKYVTLQGVNIAYKDRGAGQPMLMLHGFASFAYTWDPLIKLFGDQFRFISIDQKGWGYSEKKCDGNLSPHDQAKIITEFIYKFDLDNIILVGHSMGGAASLITLFDNAVRKRVDRLILVDSAGFFQHLPKFIEEISQSSSESLIVKYVNEEVLAHMVLTEVYCDPGKIKEETIKQYGAVLRQPGAKECMIAASTQVAIANQHFFHGMLHTIDVPVLIIWGEEDYIIDVEDAFHFHRDLPDSVLKIIPRCGHSPQEEMPEETAGLIAEFLKITLPEIKVEEADSQEEKPSPMIDSQSDSFLSQNYLRKLQMRRLIDRWSLSTLIFIIFIKVLQFMKKLGFKAEENGWRRASQVYLRKEHSKFCLASFRLDYLSGRKNESPCDFACARQILISRLAEFLKENPVFHWYLSWGRFAAKRGKRSFIDITEAEFDSKGNLLRIQPHFDGGFGKFETLTEQDRNDALAQIISMYNASRRVRDKKRPLLLTKKLKTWAIRTKKMSIRGQLEMRQFIKRILGGTFIHFEVIAEVPDKQIESRLSTPNFKRRKHPGGGLLNILCRFTADFKESDLWFQYHHVPVDGMPMQEMMEKLKLQWGEVGPVVYPALDSLGAKPEVFYFGGGVFRARVYCNFSQILKMRRHLNEKYYNEMAGPASFASLLMWGLAHQASFYEHKFLFPVDTATFSDIAADRNISLLFIRPSEYFDEQDPFGGLLRFEREFNHRLFSTRVGKSESHEFLELCAMTHPLFYSFTRYFMPKALHEIIGTVGMSVIRNAEMFVSPLTDLQINGFLAIGNCRMPTEDGGEAGAVSVCGNKEQVRSYVRALKNVSENFEELIKLPEA